MIKAVIFDLDNTLLDRTITFGSFVDSFVRTYFSHQVDTQFISNRIIELDEDGYKNKNELFAELLEELPWSTKPTKAELLSFYSEEYVKCAVLMEQALEVLQHARSKYLTGLITNGRTMIQYGKIDQVAIRDAFDLILVSEEAGCKKPDPTIFQMALERLQVQADECLFIGDHPVNDVEGAARSGMHTVWLKVNQPWREDVQAKPLHQIDKLSELLELI
ncbi:HAD family hydrolase [Paenibacillus radicis (ex Gao et al. 2016)]|uniref:Haloacid dehalogenase n=1 Tax=Paenibacillus radicis (ex Gao et al. 2016) TaxID=1737354 RepID=A0A917H960_9BACL|nr:HAD family hydrolase [Paenibacillus radicis (ex Gao et al. 2016)]GGG71203.1 haloacid dehalogenase [Paenibacillus radicis (ex Gao et al. 2016)]